MRTRLLYVTLTAAGLLGRVNAQDASAPVRIDNDDIGGVVTSAKGPEAAVWVVAETTDLPTRYIKIVVTDDRGRYVLPDLPKGNCNVWSRGYGLIDSPKVQAAKGLDGRIDDPKAGWKGKGLWSTYSTRAMFHTETGKGTESKVLHFQLRPDPLAN